MADSIGFDTAPWSVDGARHPGDLLRVLAYAATDGREGLVSADDCKVHELSTPGNQIVIDPGALNILNRHPNVRNQMYVANGRTESRLDVAPTTSSGSRSDLVILRCEDPQYAGWTQPSEADAPTYRYARPIIIQNVSPTIKHASELNLNYPAIALARIDIPPSTATITDGMIVNLAKIASPQEKTKKILLTPPPEDALTEVDWRTWPNWTPTIDVPTWARRAIVLGTLYSVGHRINTTAGALAVQLGTLQSAEVPYDLTGPGGSGERLTLGAMGDLQVPANMRGTKPILKLAGRRNAGQAGYLVTVTGTQLIFDVTFYEEAA